MNTLKKWSITLGAVVSIVALTALGCIYYYSQEVNGYPDTQQFASKINALPNSSQQKSVLIFHKPGCPDCIKARGTIKQMMKQNKQLINYIVVNTNKAQARQYLVKYGVTQVPTIIYLKGDKVMDSTSSTNQAAVVKVMAGDS